METVETVQPKKMTDKEKLLVKSVIIFVLVFVLWLPTNIILNMVRERAARQKEATADISSKWAGKQSVTGPFLIVPYKESALDEKGNKISIEHTAYFTPDKLSIQSTVTPEKRHRGIYEVAVYRGDITLSGKFESLKWRQLNVAAEDIEWEKAHLVFKVQDNVKGINEDLRINWGDSSLLLNPQPAGLSSFPEAFAAAVPLQLTEAEQEHTFFMKLSLNGSEQLVIDAIGRENNIQMKSNWGTPGFTGVKLPDTRSVSDSGFVASWKYLNRTIPAVWRDSRPDLSSSSLGADFLIPVDSYDKTERSVKYALLCIFLTFAAFFLVETIYKRPLHYIQYGLAGAALVLFYTLLLSISEYTGYNPAYLIAGLATIGLITWYVGSIMKSSKLAVFISFVLTVVYTYIFTIIQLEDYALLMGSVGLFAALGIIMFFSRKLQWQAD